MVFSNGTRVGPYEVLSLIGAGGMGEVYRARDARLNRDVAIKVLPQSFAADQERLRRFTLEAQSAGKLNHPNILAIYDIGTHEGVPYIVSELLEGETLRKRLLSGKLSVAKTLDYARQIASGLAAAHSRGITHRDIKPDNLFVTKDGHVKILDFGLAKAQQTRTREQTQTAPLETNPGAVLGTAAYMSPEQVRGEPADHRSDIFSFGCVLYEMLGGQVAFRRDSAVETMNAILKEEAPEFSASDRGLPPGLERIVRKCLEKTPEQRFQSASDLAFAIEAISGISTPNALEPPVRPRATRTKAAIAVVALLILVAALSAWIVAHRTPGASVPLFRRLSFRRGTIYSARFTPDGKSVIYGAEWDGNPLQLFSSRVDTAEARP